MGNDFLFGLTLADFLHGLTSILGLGVLIVIHELGHFLVAKWCGVGVVRFSVGFGPVLFKRKIGETVYQLCLIPLGGYVRMLGDMPDMLTGQQATDELVRDSADSSDEKAEEKVETDVYLDDDIDPELLADRSRWFLEKGLIARSLIVAAGPVFNFVLAAVIMAFCFITYGQEVLVEEAKIGVVKLQSPAHLAGIKEGDLITSLDGSAVNSWEDFSKGITSSEGRKVVVGLKRGDLELQIPVTPDMMLEEHNGEKRVSGYMVGVHRPTKLVSIDFFDSIPLATEWTWTVSVRTVMGLWKLFTGEVSVNELAGPVYILKEANRQAEKGFRKFLRFMAFLSVSLGVLNLLPIPVLDGGHLLFFFYEALMGPISVRRKEAAQAAGMLMLLGLMGFVIINDFGKDPKKMEIENSTWRGASKGNKDSNKSAEPPPVVNQE